MYLTNDKRDDGDMDLEMKLRHEMLLSTTLLVKQLVKKLKLQI